VDVAGLLHGRERVADAYAQTTVRARWLPADALTTQWLHRPDTLPLVGARLGGEVKNVTWLQASAADVQSAAELVLRGASAGAAIAHWSDVRIAELVRDLATQVAERAEHFAASAVAEAGAGNLVAETRANQQASLGVSETLAHRQMTKSSDRTTTGSTHTTVELCFVPQRYPVATVVAATLLALDAGRAIILSCEQAAHQRCRHVARLIAEVLRGHGASHNLVQWVQWGTAEETALGLMASMGNVVLLGDDANQDQEQEAK
jgi:acyl-CoA reductase-like NAD-dependent aldehyde dehydrogenase